MKKLIYLPLIAIIVLSGCKGNSFMTQRYTKFGHNAHKNLQRNNEPIKLQTTALDKKVEPELVKSLETPRALIASGLSSIKETILKPDRKVYNLNTSGASESFSKYENAGIESSNLKSQKVISKKIQREEGLIASAFMTALYVVLVVVFIILIIFLISLLA